MYRFSFLILCFLCLFSCEQDDEMLVTPLSAECEGDNMIGKWLVIDSIETRYENLDSVEYNIHHTQIMLYENSIGNVDYPYTTDKNYFNWSLQCEPDIFVMSIPFNNEDSIFNYSGFFSVDQFDILVNELDYKRLMRNWKTTPTSEIINTTYRELYKIP